MEAFQFAKDLSEPCGCMEPNDPNEFVDLVAYDDYYLVRDDEYPEKYLPELMLLNYGTETYREEVFMIQILK